MSEAAALRTAGLCELQKKSIKYTRMPTFKRKTIFFYTNDQELSWEDELYNDEQSTSQV